MEVHHHAHPSTSSGHRKKWTHYLWEFLMLFLAVFCGFLAENFREHLADRKKEMDFALSLLEDLKKDTTRINYSLGRLKTNLSRADSLAMLYIKGDKEPDYEKKMARNGYFAGLSVDVVFNDRTSSQLKGTGSMRLIRNKKVADSILIYWNNQIRIAQIHERFESFRLEQRKLGWKTFNWYALNFNSGQQNSDSNLLKLNLDQYLHFSNKQELNEFMNACSSLYQIALSQYLPDLEDELRLAIHIITIIRQEYQID